MCKKKMHILIHPLRRPLALGRGRILISGLIWFPPMLVVYDVHSLLLGVDRNFPKGISHTSLVLLQKNIILDKQAIH